MSTKDDISSVHQQGIYTLTNRPAADQDDFGSRAPVSERLDGAGGSHGHPQPYCAINNLLGSPGGGTHSSPGRGAAQSNTPSSMTQPPGPPASMRTPSRSHTMAAGADNTGSTNPTDPRKSESWEWHYPGTCDGGTPGIDQAWVMK